MMRLAIAAMAVALATPVAAQDTSADFREAYTRVYGDRAPEIISAAEEGLGILSTIPGTWTRANDLMQGPDFDPEVISNGCLFRSIQITTVGDYSFRTEWFNREDPTGRTQSYTFRAGLYYTFTSDLNGLLNMLSGGRELTEFPPQQVLGWMHSTSGVARVEGIGPDVVMIDSPNASPQILVRCP